MRTLRPIVFLFILVATNIVFAPSTQAQQPFRTMGLPFNGRTTPSQDKARLPRVRIAASKNEILEFLRNYINDVSNFIIPNASAGRIEMESSFSVNSSGYMKIEEIRNISSFRGTTRRRYEVNLADLAPNEITFSNNPGFGYMDLMLVCTNHRKCVRITDLSTGHSYLNESFYVPLESREELERLAKAFSAAINLFGGKKSSF